MTSLRDRLMDFSGSIGLAASNAPDDYPSTSHWTYETNMADLKELWAEIRPKLKNDIKQAEFIDRKLQEMFAAFESGKKAEGRKAAWEIYNVGVKQLK